MMKTEGTYIWVAYKNVFGHISTNSWPFFMIQRLTIRWICAWVRSNTWQDKRLVATGLDRFFSVFQNFNKPHNWQPKKFRICATATGGPVFCSWVQFDFGFFFSPADWTCEHYIYLGVCIKFWPWECNHDGSWHPQTGVTINSISMSTTYLKSLGADLSEIKLCHCVSILLTGMISLKPCHSVSIPLTGMSTHPHQKYGNTLR